MFSIFGGDGLNLFAMPRAVAILAATGVFMGAGFAPLAGQDEVAGGGAAEVAVDAEAAVEGAGNGAAAEAASLDVEVEAAPEVIRGVTFFERLEQGGFTMVFLLLLSVTAITFTIERAFNLRRGAVMPDGLADTAKELWTKDNDRAKPDRQKYPDNLVKKSPTRWEVQFRFGLVGGTVEFQN